MSEPWFRVALVVDCWPAEARVSTNENAKLTLSFLPEEVSRAIAEMNASSVPSLNGLLVSFFRSSGSIFR